MKPFLRFAALSLALVTAQAAYAVQPDGPAIAAPDERSVAVAREILDLGMPAQNREAVFFATMDQMMAQMREAQNQSAGIDDPQVEAIVDRHLADFRLDAQAILSRQIPDLMEAWALSYASMFTYAELVDIRDFVATPSGQRFFELSPAISAEPNFAAANQRYMNEIMALLPGLQEELRADLIEYLSSLQAEPSES